MSTAPASKEAAAKVCRDIRRAFAGQVVPRGDYEDLIDSMPGGDPDDHPHAAAAVVRAPSMILTRNVRDFPAGPLGRMGVTVCPPDDYLVDMLDDHPDEFAEVVCEMSADRCNPPMTIDDIIGALARAGVPRVASRLRRLGL